MTISKHPFFFNLILILGILALASCNSGSAASSDTAQAASGSFKVALLLPGEINDKGWSQAGYEGLKLIEKELGAEVVYTANAPEAEAEKIFRQYAEEGYDFIIGHGGEYVPAAEVVADEFPRTKFAVMTSYEGNNKNLGALSFRQGEVGYLMGVVAALKTKTNKIAYIGADSYPHMQEKATLFERGAKATNPAIEVSVEWVGSWTDQEKAREIALALGEKGTDVMVADADTAGLAVHEVAKSEGLYSMGWALDQHELSPETILTSAVQQIPVLMVEGATLVQQGRWEGKQYKFGMQEKAQDLAPFYGLLTAEEEARVAAIKEDILLGKIDVNP